ncbi:MAG: UDP-N-acetylmuramoyl-tripeptide--D-alanyl-D-alanine ligase [Verrucomicrobia bacterium]|nr:UDP-N-acetylmuramoyl-tripeptide--D-alanyl-D-alanine ligase [Verrucomicrobiota bacterium]
MPEFTAQLLADWTGGHWTAPPAAALTGFAVDTRQLRAGQIFVAIKTDKRDGHDYLPEALAAGAAAALVARPDRELALPQLVVADPLAAFQAIARQHRRAFRGPVVGISGSAGKTSTKDLLALLLGGEAGGVLATEGNLNKASIASGAPMARGVLATEGNLNNHLGVPLTLTRLDPARHAFAVVEAGVSAPGEMKPLADMIEPDVSLITLVAAAHTEELGGIEGVAREKAGLPAATRASGVAMFSKATAEFGAFRDLGVRKLIIERAEVVRPAEPPKDRVYFAVTHREDETAVALAYGPPPPLTFTFRRVSDGMAQNAVLAICAALWLGVPRTAIHARLAGWKPAKLRGEIRRDDGRLLYLDCYNANPASMADALATFTALAPEGEPRLYLIGCMEELGPEAPAHHRALGRSLRLGDEDQLFVIGTHASAVCAGVLDTGNFTRQIQIVATLEPVIARLEEWRGAVFVKGSRRYQLEKVLEVQTSLPLVY